MKILHLADLHLGKTINGLSMIDNQRHVLKQAIELCVSKDVKNIIISGDVTDRSIAPEEAIKLLNDFLSEAILEKHLNVYIISGNHDSKERLSCFNGILEKQGLFIDSKINKDLSMPKHVIHVDDFDVNVYSLPYVYAGEIRSLSNDDSINDYEKAVRKVLESNPLNKNEINIINTHYFVTGKEGTALIRSDSESKRIVGTIEQIPYTVFDDFDYVALGHLHCPQSVGRDMVRYAGSPLRYSVDEIKQNKTFTIIDIKGKNDITITEEDIKPLNEFVELTGTVDDLTVNSEIKDFRIVYFKLTDETIVVNASNRLKIKYPYYVGLDYLNIKNSVDEDESIAKQEGFEELSLSEQFDKFFNLITEKDLDETQKQVVEKVVDELEKETQ